MKKFLNAILLLATFAVFALPAHAATPHSVKRSTLVEWLDTSEAILQDLQSSTKTAIPAEVLRRAQGIVVINQVQAGLFFGIKDGYAVALVRRPNGQWSIPIFLRAAETSLGLQIGVRSVNKVLVIMDEPTTRLLLKSRFNFGAEAKAVAGVRASESEALNKQLFDGANVLAYSQQEGFFVGASVKTGFMQPDETSNRLFYQTNHRAPELLFSDWVTPPPEAQFIMNYVNRLTSR
ncbi:MAG: lipid-binding SYLF domain-containing protein [Candidatus Didemnitutus sp.]|nr:lipid-binding SYLF domain-containing protein [Candidatus Didemnitutus sp.]